MKALWALLLAAPAWAGPIAKVPELSAPLAAPIVAPAPAVKTAAFPVETGAQFFQGAARIVDLGGAMLSRWTVDLARQQRQAELHVVNIEDAGIPESVIQKDWGVPNLRAHTYDFFDAEPGRHPTGDRVIMNSPNFGGVPDELRALQLAQLIDRHVEDGGLFYAQGDNLFFMSLNEMSRIARRDMAAIELGKSLDPRYKWLGELLEEREGLVQETLERAFGKHNVSRKRLKGYEGVGLDAPGDFAFQVRKR